MNKKILVFSAIALSAFTFAQTGVGVMTENPQGTFHVDAAGDNAATGAPTTAQQGNDMVVLSDGRVGVGTTTPGRKLHILSSGTVPIKVESNAFKQTVIEFTNMDNLNAYVGFGQVAGIFDSTLPITDGEFGVNPGNGNKLHLTGNSTPALTVIPTGNVGIGTTTPLAKLDIAASSINSNVLSLHMTMAGSGMDGTYINFAAPQIGGQTEELAYLRWTRDGSQGRKLSVHTSDNSGNQYISTTFDYNGNVGIGTITPTHTLDVQGTTKTVSLLGPSTTNFHIDAQSTQNIWLNYSSGSGGVHIGNGAGGYGQAYAAAFNVSSDARLKTNIVPMNNGLNTVMRLNPVSYDKKASLTSTDYTTHEYGFLAQELQKVLPTLVGEGNDAGHTLSVNYVAIIPVLVKAIQEQQVQIEALKAKK